ncbi:hypothetical protein CAPTEDRAFT_185432 [Capitella teleta]|uniref:RRM domain-containing protein n=1 Tax=Capitella teleta TaxID=283909 RepID=R7UXJ3_CAPTE|nr:hypothetical protein CAPTEDRAFT_185432 [Capitella teleta]|eukprot:ELU08106.1 hypothetical protein CAPTEDRAFT_185432 [Capitella teleta]
MEDALQSSRERIVRYYTREHCYVFIEGLAPGVSISRLRILFSDHGVVEDVQVREEDHCAWIKFKQAKDALKAKKLTNNTAIGNTRVKVVTLSEEPSRVIRILSAFCGSLTGKGHNGGMNIRDYQKRVSLFFKTASMVKIFDSRQGLLYFSSIPEAVRQLPKMSLQFPSSAGRSFKYLDYHFAQREHEVFCYEDVPYENAIFDQYRPDHLSVALKSIPSARNMPITPPRQTPPGKTPLGQTPPGQTPPGKTPLGQTPPGQTPPGQTPLGRTPPVTSKKSDPPPTPPPKETGKPKTPVNNQVAKPKWKMLDSDNGEMYLHQLYSKEVVDLSFSATASRTLIVKNVNKYQDETEASMRQRFSRYGFVVSVYATGKIFDNKTEIGISSFSVEYDHLLSAAFAMHHNQTLKEAKTFIVTFADAAPSTLVWFSFGLPGSSVHLNDRALLDAFKEHFSITEMSVFRRQRYGFIRFCTLMKAMNAIQMRTNFTLAGKRIHLDFGSLSFLQLANDILEANPINFLLPGELGMTENKSANVSRYLGVVPRSCNVTLKEVQAIFIKYGLILDLFVMPHPEKRDQIIIEFETIFAVQDVLKPRTVKALGSQFILVQCMIPAASDCLHIVSKQKNPVADAISKQPNFFMLFDGTHNQTGIFDSIRSSFDFITSHRKNWSEFSIAVVVPGVEQAEVFEYGTRSLKVTSIAININRDHDVKLKPGVELIVEFDSVMACVKAMRDNTTHHLHALCKAPHVPLKMSFEYPTALSRKLWFGSLPIRIDCRAIQLHLQDSDWDLTSLKINECNGTAVALCSSDKVSARIKCKVASEAATTGWEVAFASIALFDMFSILKQSATPSLPSVCDVAENDPCHVKATRTILVQNIDRNVGEEDVTDAFRNCNGYLGLRLRENLNKKTLEAFVEFHTITAATELLRRSDVRIKGCPVKVEFAPHIASNCLWIGNLPKPHMEETLLAKFKSFGKLFAPTFVYDGRIALIHFANVQNAVDAFCKADRKIANTQLHIDFASQLLQDALFVNECGPKDLKEINGNLSSLADQLYAEDEKEDDSIFFCPSGLVLTVENVAESQVNVVCQEFARFGQVLDLVYADSQVTLHLDSVQGALKAIQEMNGQFVGDQVIRVRFGRVTSPNVWLGNMTAGTDYKAVRTMLIRFGTLASFKAAPAVGQVFAEYHSESFAQLAEESLKGQSVGKIRLLSSGISAKAGLRLMAKHGLPVADLNPEQPPAKKMKLDETSRATPKPAVTPPKRVQTMIRPSRPLSLLRRKKGSRKEVFSRPLPQCLEGVHQPEEVGISKGEEGISKGEEGISKGEVGISKGEGGISRAEEEISKGEERTAIEGVEISIEEVEISREEMIPGEVGCLSQLQKEGVEGREGEGIRGGCLDGSKGAFVFSCH